MDIPTIKALLMTLIIVGFTVVAAVVDWRTNKLPNWLTVSCFASALAFHFVAGFFGENAGISQALAQTGWALAGFATGFGILFVMWVCGWGGGGDVKMMGAMGAWLLPTLTLYVFILTALLTLVMYFRQIFGGLAQPKTNQQGEVKQAVPHHAHYAFRAGLAVWLVVAYFLIQQQTFPFLQPDSPVAEEIVSSNAP